MQNQTLAPANDQPIGLVTIGKTTFRVYCLEVRDAQREYGVENQFGLYGPRGSTFLVIDHGPRYGLNTLSVNGRGYGRRLVGITRAHLAAFGVREV